MSPSYSTLDTLLFGFPIVGMLFLVFFRLDERIARPQTKLAVGHPLSHLDSDGQFVCIEPDGSYVRRIPAEAGRRRTARIMGDKPRRGAAMAVPRISVEWVENSDL